MTSLYKQQFTEYPNLQFNRGGHPGIPKKRGKKQKIPGILAENLTRLLGWSI